MIDSPALFTSTSSRPNRSSVASTIAARPSTVVTSAATADLTLIARYGACRLIEYVDPAPAIVQSRPEAARRRGCAAEPGAAPVTIATRRSPRLGVLMCPPVSPTRPCRHGPALSRNGEVAERVERQSPPPERMRQSPAHRRYGLGNATLNLTGESPNHSQMRSRSSYDVRSQAVDRPQAILTACCATCAARPGG